MPTLVRIRTTEASASASAVAAAAPPPPESVARTQPWEEVKNDSSRVGSDGDGDDSDRDNISSSSSSRSESNSSNSISISSTSSSSSSSSDTSSSSSRSSDDDDDSSGASSSDNNNKKYHQNTLSRSARTVALAVDTNSNTDEIDDGSAAGMSESHQNENDDNDANDKNNEECEICGDGGDLICCDFCPKCYHADCLQVEDPDSLPDPWHCSSCVMQGVKGTGAGTVNSDNKSTVVDSDETNILVDSNDKTNKVVDNDGTIAAVEDDLTNSVEDDRKNTAAAVAVVTTAAAVAAAVDDVKNNLEKVSESPIIQSAPVSECDDGKSALAGVEPQVNMLLDILDSDSYYWSKGIIIHVKNITPKGPNAKPPAISKGNCFVTVRHEGWGSLLCEELPYPNERLAPVATYTKPVKCFVTLSGLKAKDFGFAVKLEPNKNVLNWTNVWPCKIYLRAPHQNNIHASDLLRNQNNLFVQPYMTYLLPHYLAKHMSHGGQWLTVDHCRQWKNLSVKDGSTDVTCLLQELSSRSQKTGSDSYFVTNKFCQAYRTAQSDPLPVELPASLFPKQQEDRHDSRNGPEQKMSKSHPPKAKNDLSAPLIEHVPTPIPKLKSKSAPQPMPKPENSRDSEKSVKRKRKNSPHPPTSSDVAIKTPPPVKPKPEPVKRRGSQTNSTRRRSISPRPTISKAATLLPLETAPLPAVKSAASTSWFERPPFLPPPIPITDMTFPNQGVRHLPDSNRWASVLRVSGNELFVGFSGSQSEAAYGTKLASEELREESEQGGVGVETTNDQRDDIGGLDLMTHFSNFASASNISEVGKLSDLFNTSAELIVSAFEEAQSRKDQKQSSDVSARFRLQDWVNVHSTHNMQQLKDMVLSDETTNVVSNDFAFVVDVKSDENVHRKRRKKSNPRRLPQISVEAEQNITYYHSAGTT